MVHDVRNLPVLNFNSDYINLCFFAQLYDTYPHIRIHSYVHKGIQRKCGQYLLEMLAATYILRNVLKK